MQYPYLQDYILTQEKVDLAIKEKSIRKLRHVFYPLSTNDIKVALESFNPFPVELKTFYEEIGFGNFHCNREYVNCLLDPHSLVYINRQMYRFRYDKEVEWAITEGRLIFFRTYMYQYLTIEMKDVDGKNAVYYKKRKLDDSLSSFIKEYDNERNLVQYHIGINDEQEVKKGIPQPTLRNTFVYRPEEKHAEKTPSSSPGEEKPEIIKPQAQPQPQNPNKNRWTTLFDDDDIVIRRKT